MTSGLNYVLSVVIHMSKFIKNDTGIMGLTLSQIGLIIVTSILLAAIFSILFLNDWQRKAELENITTSFSTIVEAMDTRFFENITKFYFPEKSYTYNVSLSTEYIILTANGNQNNKLSIKEQLIRKTWPRTSYHSWKTGEELHNYCLYTYGHSGALTDPISQADMDRLTIERENASRTLAVTPVYIQKKNLTYIEKVIIHSDDTEKKEYILVYQL